MRLGSADDGALKSRAHVPEDERGWTSYDEEAVEAATAALKKEDTSLMERPRSRRNRVYGNDIKRTVANNPREEIIDEHP